MWFALTQPPYGTPMPKSGVVYSIIRYALRNSMDYAFRLLKQPDYPAVDKYAEELNGKMRDAGSFDHRRQSRARP
jgi:hypothetical protein